MKRVVGALLVASLSVAAKRPPVLSPPPLVTPPPVRSNETRIFSNSYGWQIRIDDSIGGGCFAVMAYDNGAVLRIGFNPRTSDGYIMLGNDAWKSLEAGKVYDLTYTFDTGTPWTAEAKAINMGPGAPMLSATFAKPEFLTEFASKTSLVVRRGDVVVTNLSLDHSQDAASEIARCQKYVGANADPFAGAPKRSPQPQPTDPFSPS